MRFVSLITVCLSLFGLASSYADFTPEQAKTAVSAWTELVGQIAQPLESGSGIFSTQDDEAWLDGDALRAMLLSVREKHDPRINQPLTLLNGVRLRKQGDALVVSIYFVSPVEISLADYSGAKRLSPYAVVLPEVVRFKVQMTDGLIHVYGLDDGKSVPYLLVKIPFLPDTIYLRDLTLDLASGDVRIEAGALGDAVTWIGGARIYAKKFDGTQIWETIYANLGGILGSNFILSRK